MNSTPFYLSLSAVRAHCFCMEKDDKKAQHRQPQAQFSPYKSEEVLPGCPEVLAKPTPPPLACMFLLGAYFLYPFIYIYVIRWV